MLRRLRRKPGRADAVRALVLALILAVAALNGGTRALADVDPPGCQGNGVSISLNIFDANANGTIGGTHVGNVQEGQLLFYRATLAWIPGTCAYEGGNWLITTPDGVAHNVGPVPRIGDNSTGTGAAPSVTKPLATDPWDGRYVVRAVDEKARPLPSSARYIGTNTTFTQGFFHNSPGDSQGGASGSSTLTNNVNHPDLHLAKADSPDPVLSGNQLTYTITATNNGVGDAPNSTVTDTWPAGFAATGATPSQGSCAAPLNPSLSCNLGTIAGNGGTASVTVVGTVSGCANLTNTANVGTSATELHAVSGGGTTSGTTDNSATATTVVQCATQAQTKLQVQDRMTNLPVGATGTVTYSLFANANCTGSLRAPETVAIAGAIGQNKQGPLSTVFAVNPGVTVYFQATYNGDATYPPSTSPCIKEQASVGP